MKTKREYVSLKKHSTMFLNNGIKVGLPDGCTGVMFVFKSKKSARKWDGEDTELKRVWFEEKL